MIDLLSGTKYGNLGTVGGSDTCTGSLVFASCTHKHLPFPSQYANSECPLLCGGCTWASFSSNPQHRCAHAWCPIELHLDIPPPLLMTCPFMMPFHASRMHLDIHHHLLWMFHLMRCPLSMPYHLSGPYLGILSPLPPTCPLRISSPMCTLMMPAKSSKLHLSIPHPLSLMCLLMIPMPSAKITHNLRLAATISHRRYSLKIPDHHRRSPEIPHHHRHSPEIPQHRRHSPEIPHHRRHSSQIPQHRRQSGDPPPSQAQSGDPPPSQAQSGDPPPSQADSHESPPPQRQLQTHPSAPPPPPPPPPPSRISWELRFSLDPHRSSWLSHVSSIKHWCRQWEEQLCWMPTTDCPTQLSVLTPELYFNSEVMTWIGGLRWLRLSTSFCSVLLGSMPSRQLRFSSPPYYLAWTEGLK